MIKFLNFKPLPGLASPHLQMVFSNFSPPGLEPPSNPLRITVSDGDQLSCHISTPTDWKETDPTIAMVHGLGGSHLSSYMIRLSRKFYQVGARVVRINLRGCGSGFGLNNLPYNSGNSHDIWTVMEALKAQHPHSSIHLIGFSLGGNIIVKMAGEHGERASQLLNCIISVCSPLDLSHSVLSLTQKSNWIYHKYYLKNIFDQGQQWIKNKKIRSLYEFDDKVTAPLWGYQSAGDYYDKCSSYKFIHNIRIPCHLVLSSDDPFVDPSVLKRVKLSPNVNVWITSSGGHMGFISWTGKEHGYHWMDQFVMNLLQTYSLTH